MSSGLPKSVFLGTPDFAVPSFRAALATTDVIAVVTQPDRPRGRGQKLSPCPVKEAALAEMKPVFSPASLRKPSEEREKLFAFLEQHPADLFLVAAYGNLLPESFLQVPRLGSINVHASLLPRWRGAAPIQRSLETGDTETGVCLQKMVLELDAGDVLSSRRLRLDGNEDAIALTAALSTLGGELLGDYLKRHGRGPLLGQVQDPSLVTFAPKITKEEGFWSPDWTALQTHNRMRAFAAWPGVRARLSTGGDLKLVEARPVTGPLLSPGEIVLDGEKVLLGCLVRAGEPEVVSLLRVQPENRSAVEAKAFFQNLFSQTKAAGQHPPKLLKIQI